MMRTLPWTLCFFLWVVCGACTATNSYEATYEIVPPSVVSDSTLAHTDKQGEDLADTLVSAGGIAFLPPEACPSDALCEALLESLEKGAAARGIKVISWREAVGQDAKTLTFLGADLLVEVTDFQISELRLLEEKGRVDVEIREIMQQLIVSKNDGPRRMRFKRDENGRLIPIEQGEEPPPIIEKQMVTDPKIVARVNDMCVQNDIDIIHDLVTRVDVNLALKVRMVQDSRVVWIYGASSTGSAHKMEGEISLSRQFKIETDKSGNIQAVIATVGLVVGVVGTVAMVVNIRDQEASEDAANLAEDGFEMADESIEAANTVQPPVCHAEGTREFFDELAGITSPSSTAQRLEGLVLSDFFSRFVHIKSLGKVPAAEQKVPEADPVLEDLAPSDKKDAEETK